LKLKFNKKFFIQLLIFLFLAGATYFGFAPLQSAIQGKLSDLKSEAVHLLEKNLGRKISYEKISPSLFRNIKIQDLVIYEDRNGSRPLAKIDQLRVYYKIFKLLSDDPASAFYEVRIVNSSFSIDAKNDSDLIELVTDLVQRAPETDSLAITFSGRNLELLYTQAAGSVHIERLFFSLEPSDADKLSISIRGKLEGDSAEREEDIPSLVPQLRGIEQINTSIRLSGEVSSIFDRGNLQVSFDDFQTNLFSLEEQNFLVLYENRRIDVQKIKDKAPIDISLSLDLAEKWAELSLLTENFVPNRYITLREDYPSVTPWLDSTVSGELSGTYFWEKNAVEYSADVLVYAENEVLPLPATAKLKAEGNEEGADIELAEVSTKNGELAYTGRVEFPSFFPRGVLTVSNFLLPTGHRITTMVSLDHYRNRLTLFTDAVWINELKLDGLRSTVTIGADSIELILRTGVAENPGARIALEGYYDRREEQFLEGILQLDEISVHELAALIPSKKIRGELKKRTEDIYFGAQIFFSTDFTQFAYVSPDFNMYSAPGAEDLFSTSFGITGNNRSLSVTNLEGRWNDIRYRGSLDADFEDPGDIDFKTNLSINNVEYQFTGLYQKESGLFINGSYNTKISVLFSSDGLFFNAGMTDFPVELPGFAGKIRFDLYGMFRSREDWQCYVKNVEVQEGRVLKDLFFTLSGRIFADDEKVIVRKLSYTDRYSRINGLGRFDFRSMTPITVTGWFTGNDPTQKEQYDLRLQYAEGAVDARIDFVSSPMHRFTGKSLKGEVSGSAGITGEWDSPAITYSVQTVSAQFNNEKIEFRGNGELTKNELLVDSFLLSYLSNRTVIQNLLFDFSRGTFSARGNFSGIFQNKSLTSRIEISGKTKKQGTWEKLPDIIGNDFRGKIELDPIFYGNKPLKPWRLDFRKKQQEIDLSGGPETALRATVRTDGSFELKLSDPIPIKMFATGTVKNNRIDAKLNNMLLDFEAINTLLRIPYFNVKEGKGFGSLEIRGSITDPDFFGRLQIIDGIAENPLVTEPLGPFNAEFLFDGKEFTVPPLYIYAGPGGANTKVTFFIDHWIPREYEIELATVGKRWVPMQGSFSNIDVQGDTEIDLHLKGDFSGIDVTGDITAHNAVITIGEKEEESPKRRTFETSVDLDIYTGRQVEFLWPSASFPVLRTFAESGKKVEISYNSIARTYSIDGEVTTRGGQIFYFSKNFYITEAKIIFNEEQGRFDPILYARADLREVSTAGEDVTITLVVDEKPFSQFAPRFESSPPLPSTEILALLGQNVITELGGEAINLSQALALTSGIVFNQFGLMKSIEDAIRDVFNLDLFSIRTQMLENLLAERIFGSAAGTGEGEQEVSSLGRYLDNTTLFLGKYLSEDIFLEAMVGLRLKETGDKDVYTKEEFEVDTEITLEWKTPLALLEFSFMPDMTDLFGAPPALSLALSWGFSF
jgi:hypothetical protein